LFSFPLIFHHGSISIHNCSFSNIGFKFLPSSTPFSSQHISVSSSFSPISVSSFPSSASLLLPDSSYYQSIPHYSNIFFFSSFFNTSFANIDVGDIKTVNSDFFYNKFVLFNLYMYIY
jgi:hypothetical protein